MFLATNGDSGGILRFVITLVNPDLAYQGWLSGMDSLISVILGIGTLIGVAYGVLKIIRRIIKDLGAPYITYKKNVDRYYGKNLRHVVSRYYIPTRGQDIDPCDQEEIREDNGTFLSEPLIPFFCHTALTDRSHGRYYMILADSGMGKSTFMVSLYRKYLLGNPFRAKKKIVLIPLTLRRCLQRIEKVEDKENTILLLDALDENRRAMQQYESFFQDLLDVTENFYKVVITCRTQFFPNRMSEPDHAGWIQVGVGNKAERIYKKYLSPFSDEDVRVYLKKRYRFRRDFQKKASDIVHKVPALMARPVILNWMDFLCDSPRNYKNTFSIYTTIIDKWIEREDLGNSANKLKDLSVAIANYMLRNATTTMPAEQVEEIARSKDIRLEPIIAKSRSLLNRNSKGEYKFAHRSFLEYLIVYGLFTEQVPLSHLHIAIQMDGVRRFLLEMFICSGKYPVAWVSNREAPYPDYMRFPDARKIFDLRLVLEYMLSSQQFLVSKLSMGNGYLIICRTYAMVSDVIRIADKTSRESLRQKVISLSVTPQRNIQIRDGVIEIEYKFNVDKSYGPFKVNVEMNISSQGAGVHSRR